ncbi:Flp pilus assembly protein CpaB [Rhodospira trueperi]|uniref:Flp pilus assembly protein CpaB n=1 Tax=Rhodospira trueperi TaxID=69960 RepID=A0A1G7DZ89_9PROT|nr:Flp pilus assembly protein CpaB [Rhodospira trueperi]SDE56702.1 Flp pilus assembly protein CpaB [Rhodospira trueperi]
MRAVLILVLTIAVVAAGGAVYLVNNYLEQQRQLAADSQEQLPVFTGQRVLVADANIDPGSPLRSSVLRWQPWPAEDILPSYKVIGDVEGLSEQAVFDQRTRLEAEMTGKIARRAIAAGEPITDKTVFTREDANFMAGALNPGMRAVAIPVDEESGAAGFILPGDLVDVILTHDLQKSMPRGSGDSRSNAPVSRYLSETILESLRVLAVDQMVMDEDGEPQLVDTVTVEVTAREAEVINLAKEMGSMTLTLRALTDRQAPVGLAALFGIGPAEGPVDRPLVSDRSISGGLDMMMRAGQGADEVDPQQLRRAQERIRELETDLEQARAEAASRGAQQANTAADTGPGWTVTVYAGGEDSEPKVYPLAGEGEGGASANGDDSPWGEQSADSPTGITPEMAEEIPMDE